MDEVGANWFTATQRLLTPSHVQMSKSVERSGFVSDLVIWFFGIILMMVKQPESTHLINWQIRFFDRFAASIDPQSGLYLDAMRMAEELEYVKRRRRSRREKYNVSNIDEVYSQYYIGKSPQTLGLAWDLYHSGAYRTEVAV